MELILCLVLLVSNVYMLPFLGDLVLGPLLNNLTEVCYSPFGCFSRDGTFNSISLPESPDTIKQAPDCLEREDREKDVGCSFNHVENFVHEQLPQKSCTSFILSIRGSNQNQTLNASNITDALKIWTNFNTRRTIIIIHGYLTKVDGNSWMEIMAAELLKNGDVNAIVVNWNGGNQGLYPQAAANTRLVGAQIAYLCNYLIRAGKITAGDVHIIGHSLGAHIAGYAGQIIPYLFRISALDAFRPLFQGSPPKGRLDPTDAIFVDVIHSNTLVFGTSDISGHAEFYPNGGYSQPGCGLSNLQPKEIIDNFFEVLLDYFSCSHERSYLLYIESINSTCNFNAVACASEIQFQSNASNNCDNGGCNTLGYHAVKPPNGTTVKYYLETAAEPPFCKLSDLKTKVSPPHITVFLKLKYFDHRIRHTC